MRPTDTARALLLGSTIAVTTLLISAGAASAQRCEAPPGTSGTDQYCETLPGAKGDRGAGEGPRLSGSQGRDTSTALERRGADGRAVLALPSAGKRAGGGAERGGKSHGTPSSPSGSPFGAIESAVDSGSAAGPRFIWLLAAIGVGMVGLAWVRYRRGPES